MANKLEQRYELRSNSVEEEETEMEIIVEDAQGDQPKKPNQPMDANFQEMMRIIMEGNNKTNENFKQMRLDNENLLKQNNEELKETIQQQINGVKNKLDQQKAEIKLILQNCEERNIRQSAKMKLNIETMKEIMSDENPVSYTHLFHFPN